MNPDAARDGKAAKTDALAMMCGSRLHLLDLDHERTMKRLTYRYAGRDFRLTDVQ